MEARGGFTPGSLLATLRAVSARARAAGALQPIPTEQVFLEDGGLRFLVRVLAGTARKREAREEQHRSEAEGKPANPFLPYDRELFVAEVSGTHVALLNKYQVVDDHLLIVTREFEDQRTLLTPRDFEALWRCLGEYESLGFYNGGPEAGASQPHKHLQVVPLPLARGVPEVPIGPLLALADASGKIAEVPGLGFLHAFVRLDRPGRDQRFEDAWRAYESYRALLEAVGYPPPEDGAAFQAVPYCLLVTRGWMLLVPRSREHYRSISINALGFAGALLVWDEEQLRALREAGPIAALRETALPAPPRHRERQGITSR